MNLKKRNKEGFSVLPLLVEQGGDLPVPGVVIVCMRVVYSVYIDHFRAKKTNGEGGDLLGICTLITFFY